jgi:hypothetical protein
VSFARLGRRERPKGRTKEERQAHPSLSASVDSAMDSALEGSVCVGRVSSARYVRTGRERRRGEERRRGGEEERRRVW